MMLSGLSAGSCVGTQSSCTAALACPSGYYAYTTDGVNWYCNTDYYNSPAYVNQQNQEIAASANAGGPTAAWEAAYGGLPQNVQNAIMNCQLALSNNLIFGTPIPATCPVSGSGVNVNALIQMYMPGVVSPGNMPNVVLKDGVFVPATYTNVLQQVTPGSTPPPVTNPTNVLNPPQGNQMPTPGQINQGSPQSGNTNTALGAGADQVITQAEDWLKANSTTALLVGGAIVLLMVMKK